MCCQTVIIYSLHGHQYYKIFPFDIAYQMCTYSYVYVYLLLILMLRIEWPVSLYHSNCKQSLYLIR